MDTRFAPPSHRPRASRFASARVAGVKESPCTGAQPCQFVTNAAMQGDAVAGLASVFAEASFGTNDDVGATPLTTNGPHTNQVDDGACAICLDVVDEVDRMNGVYAVDGVDGWTG